MEIKSMAAIREKWTRVTPGRLEDYKLGIQNPKRDWEEETAAADTNYKTGVDAAQAKGLFKKGVIACGSSKWKDRSLKKGPGRFAEGVYIAGPDYDKGFSPYRETIAGTDLPDRFPRGDPRNYDRVRAVGTALHDKRVGA